MPESGATPQVSYHTIFFTNEIVSLNVLQLVMMVTLDYLVDRMNERVLWSCVLKEHGVVCVMMDGMG